MDFLSTVYSLSIIRLERQVCHLFENHSTNKIEKGCRGQGHWILESPCFTITSGSDVSVFQLQSVCMSDVIFLFWGAIFNVNFSCPFFVLLQVKYAAFPKKKGTTIKIVPHCTRCNATPKKQL